MVYSRYTDGGRRQGFEAADREPKGDYNFDMQIELVDQSAGQCMQNQHCYTAMAGTCKYTASSWILSMPMVVGMFGAALD